METNELPEAIKKQINSKSKDYSIKFHEGARKDAETDFKVGAEFGYRLALQSKEEEVKQLNRSLKQANETSVHWIEKCKEVTKLEGQLKEQSRLSELVSGDLQEAKREVERLRAVNEELQLFRQKESTAYANLAEKNERLMELALSILADLSTNRQTAMNTSTREWCNCCNNYSPVSFHVPDEIWNEVTMGKFQRLCIMCFAKRADERLIDWAKDIQFFPFSLVSTDKP